MVAEVKCAGTEKRIQTKAISAFPQFFRTGHFADQMREKRLWKQRKTIILEIPSTGTRNGQIALRFFYYQEWTTTYLHQGKKGRGRKIEAWIKELQSDLVYEFDRLRKVGMKFSSNKLHLLAKEMIVSSNKEG